MPRSTWRSTARRYIKRQWRRGKKWAKKRYVKPSGRLNVRRIAKDVQLLKSIVNAEKKYCMYETNFSCGATDSGTLSGYGHYISPLVSLSQGTTVSTRNGNSVKGTSIQYAFDFLPQANCNQQLDFTVLFLLHPGALPENSYTTGSGGTLASLFLTPDYMTWYTTRSLRNVEHYKDWIILKALRCHVRADESNTSGDRTFYRKGAIKLFKHLKFDGAGASPVENQMYVLVIANTGDINGASGMTVKMQYRYHYIDN